MEKEFVSYEQALALKELEFTEPCFGYYDNGVFIFWYDSKQETELLLNCSAPLKQQAIKWIREKYKYYFWIEPCSPHKFFHFTISCSPSSFEYWTIDESKPNSGALSSYPEAENEMLNKLVELAKKYGIFREL